MTTRHGNIDFDTETLRAIYAGMPNAEKPDFLKNIQGQFQYLDGAVPLETPRPEPKEAPAPAPLGGMADVPPQPDTRQGVSFLKTLTDYPTLTAIHVDPITGAKGQIETRSFPPGANGEVDWAAVFAWIDGRNGRANLYWLVNVLREPKNQKAAKRDIALMRIAHVDVDVRVGEPQTEGIQRIVKSFYAYAPRPNFIIRSGGGAQAFWRLDPPIALDGSDESIADAESINVQLARDLDGDHCQNVDRIMRLPGSINLPDAAKMKKGRKPALATYEEML